jgi:hypothetical protein
MAVKIEHSRHVGVAIPGVQKSRDVAANSREESPEPQHPDIAYHETFVCWRGLQPLDRRLCFGHVAG